VTAQVRREQHAAGGRRLAGGGTLHEGSHGGGEPAVVVEAQRVGDIELQGLPAGEQGLIEPAE
jgi:hypothetical protein